MCMFLITINHYIVHTDDLVKTFQIRNFLLIFQQPKYYKITPQHREDIHGRYAASHTYAIN